MKRTQVSTSISPETRRQLDQLTQSFGTVSTVLTVAIDRLYQSQRKEKLMSQNIRDLTEQEELAWPGPASANAALQIDGIWYYADHCPPDLAMPITDSSGDYIPVTDEPHSIILSVLYGFHAADLIADEDDHEYDEAASAQRYAELVTESLSALFPSADVTVDYDTGASGVLPHHLQAAVNDWQDHPEIATVEDAAGKVYASFDWLVPVNDD